MKIFITGGSGFIGVNLSDHLLKKGHVITATGTSSTHAFADRENFFFLSADTTEKGAWLNDVEKADAVINLAGKNIFTPWTKKCKSRIYDSRILTTRALAGALAGRENATLISASAVGYYGDRGDDLLDEKAPAGADFLARVCKDWEKEARHAEKKGVRVALTRFGVVLGKGGGALAKMLPAYKFCLGGPLGSGDQWFPWIHMEDLLAAMDLILENREISGPLNFCASVPVRNRYFAKALGNALGRPSFLRAPAFAIRLFMGELGSALLGGQRVVPQALAKHGFEFGHPDIDKALKNIV